MQPLALSRFGPTRVTWRLPDSAPVNHRWRSLNPHLTRGRSHPVGQPPHSWSPHVPEIGGNPLQVAILCVFTREVAVSCGFGPKFRTNLPPRAKNRTRLPPRVKGPHKPAASGPGVVGDPLDVAILCVFDREVANLCSFRANFRTGLPPHDDGRTKLPPRVRRAHETATSHPMSPVTPATWQFCASLPARWQVCAVSGRNSARICHLAPGTAPDCHLAPGSRTKLPPRGR